MTVGELIRMLSYWSPDTPVKTIDGNLLTGDLFGAVYGQEYSEHVFDAIDDGQMGDMETLYLEIS